MSEKKEKIKERIKKLFRIIEFTEQNKKQIIKTVQNLLSQYNSGRISGEEYNEKLKQILKNRTIGQWIKYYDDYINYCEYQIKLCERLIKQEESEARREKLKGKTVPILKILIILVLIGIFISLFFILKPVGMDVFKNIGEKISTFIGQLRAPEEVAEVEVPEIEEVPEVYEEIIEEPEVPVSLEDKGVKISEESLQQYQAVLGKPVKWKKQFTTDSITGFTIELPEDSANIKLKRDGIDITNLASIGEEIIGKNIKIKLKKSKIIEGAIADSEIASYEITYETPTPKIIEEEISQTKKRIIISGPDDIHYKNILSFTEIPEILKSNEQTKIKLYQIKNKQRIPTKFTAYDTNENSLLDYIEWITPYLSEAVYELEIEIIDAEHLDKKRELIANIYEQVNTIDNITYTIPKNEYVRAYFERNLTNENVIDIFVNNINNNTKPTAIEVYEKDSDIVVGKIEDITQGRYYIYLNHTGNQSVFDMKSVKEEVVYDYIHDAKPAKLEDDSLIPSTTNINEGNSLTITGRYSNTGASIGTWTIQLQSNYGVINNACSGSGFRITGININICTGTCTPNIAAGTVDLNNIGAGEINRIVWTLEACAGSSADSPFTITTIKVSGDSVKFNLNTNPISINPPPKPEIVFISDILEEISPGEADRILTAGTTTQKTFEFYVYYQNLNNLPTGAAVNDNNALITLVNLAGPGAGTERKSSDADPNAATCTYIREDVAPAGSVAYIGQPVRVYSCTVAMQYYDDSIDDTNWQVKAMIKDNFGNEDSGDVTNNELQPLRETYFNPLYAEEIIGSLDSLDFGEVEYGSQTTEPTEILNEYPLKVRNIGNKDITFTTITAYNIPDTATGTEFILASWFKADDADPCNGNTLSHNPAPPGDNIGLPIIPHGPPGPSTESDLRICLTYIDESLSSQDYATQPYGTDWDISAQFTILLVAISIRKRKKKKQKRKSKQKIKKKQKSRETKNVNIQKDSLVQALNLTTKELKQEYSEDKQKIIKLLINEIKKKYKLNNKKITSLIEVKKEITIPTNIFSSKLGALEAITKYIRENLNMNYHEIAEILNRDERTIWTAYNKARQKQPESIRIKEIKISMPISVFKTKKLTILESLIICLKQKKLKYVEIAGLLNRDQRNIWTIYSRAVKKGS